MKKICLFFILTLSFPAFTSLAQNTEAQKESLQSLHGEAKVDRLNELSVQFNESGSYEAITYAQEAFDLAGQIQYNFGQAKACDNLGNAYLTKNDYKNAMKHFVDGLKIRDEMKDQKGIATSKNYIGWVFYLQEDVSNALTNLNNALEIRSEIQDLEGMAETHENLGYVHLFEKIYGKAREQFGAALDFRLQLEQPEEAVELASHLGKIASIMGDHEGALAYYHQSLMLNNAIEATEKIAEDHNNIALVYLAQARTSALDKLEYLQEAQDANQAAYDIRVKLGNKLDLAETYKNFGLIYLEMGKREKGIEHLEASAALIKAIGPEPGTQNILKSISEAYISIENFEQALRYQLDYANYRDEIFNHEKSTALLELTTKYESEFAAEEQKRQIETLENEKAFSSKIRSFLLAMIGLGVLFVIVLFFSYKRKQKDNLLLMQKNEEINSQKMEIDAKNAQLNEKNDNLDDLNQKLLKEMADRESIEQSSFARDRFLATMSHEMRTPMNIIIGLTHMLLSENPRKDQIEHLRSLQFSANNLVVFINDILDFSKIEAGKLTLENREFNPKETFEEIINRYSMTAREKGLILNCRFDEKIPDHLLGDSARLNQILTNLTTNAIKFTESGAVELDMMMYELQNTEATLLITVQDTGDGIDPERLYEMFHKFSENTEDELYDGYATSGLGLAITKRLVDLQNGKIEVESAPGHGTKFTVLLPYKVINKATKTGGDNPSKVDAIGLAQLAGNRILLVEDNKINQLVVANLLKKLGIEVITADNGIEALELFKEQYFDLVLMDIQMPKMDGYRTTAEIRKFVDPRKRDVPIIALTASAFLTAKEKAKLFGMNDHVGKPFSQEDLLEKISSCLAVYKS
jgi:signal transduction histidine kinase/BarA-like signal transduction histidine kinase